jgi:hypothetical protein
MENWLSANEWVFGAMLGLIAFLGGRAYDNFRERQKHTEADISTLGGKLDEINLTLSHIRMELRERPTLEKVQVEIDKKVAHHEKHCTALVVPKAAVNETG